MLSRLSFSTLVVFVTMVLTLLLATTSDAAKAKPKPTPKPTPSGAITLSQLTKAFAGKCPSKTTKEAITCKDALPYINSAIKKYGLKTKGQQAAYIATMAYESGYLIYDHNLVNKAQGTRSMLPAVSLRKFVDANKSVQKFWPQYPKGVDDNKIVDILIKNKLDFEPGAWWTVKGPGCTAGAAGLSSSKSSFTKWETTCIFGGADTVNARAAIFSTVYAAISK
ncbi:hypothetical protein BGZ83_010464 [Gryganskiella cystojenkinii]|nr:hypothetical protein BGZ83_010464 [Gryganskiella cystojenkinii]